MSAFQIDTSEICIGDPVMGLAHYRIALSPGLYELAQGAIAASSEDEAKSRSLELINLDGPYLYVVDGSRADQFVETFHEFGTECSYDMMEMESRHEEIELKVGTRIAFYWEGDLSGGYVEGQYVLDVSRIRPVA